MEAFTNVILNFITQWGYLAVFFLMTLSSMCIPVSSEVVILFAGFLASQGKLSLIPVILWATAGNLSGSILAYYIGRVGGRPLFLRYGRYVFIKERELDRAERWFEKYGHEAVLIGRMVPVIRAFISVPAGVAEMRFGKFLIYSTVGVIPWDIGLALAGYFLGEQWHEITKYFDVATIIVSALLLVAVAYFVYIHLKQRSNKKA